jgi:hypothetical protein
MSIGGHAQCVSYRTERMLLLSMLPTPYIDRDMAVPRPFML